MRKYRLECGEIIEGEITGISCIAPSPKYFRCPYISRDLLDKITRYVALHVGIKFWARIDYKNGNDISYVTYSWCSSYYSPWDLNKFKKKYEI